MLFGMIPTVPMRHSILCAKMAPRSIYMIAGRFDSRCMSPGQLLAIRNEVQDHVPGPGRYWHATALHSEVKPEVIYIYTQNMLPKRTDTHLKHQRILSLTLVQPVVSNHSAYGAATWGTIYEPFPN